MPQKSQLGFYMEFLDFSNIKIFDFPDISLGFLSITPVPEGVRSQNLVPR